MLLSALPILRSVMSFQPFMTPQAIAGQGAGAAAPGGTASGLEGAAGGSGGWSEGDLALLGLALIVALGLAHDPDGRFPLWEDQAALAACVQNMFLMCTAHGIGGYWSTPTFLSHPKAVTALAHDEGVQGMGLFYMGYPEGEWPGKGHRKPLEYVTRWTTD